MLLSANNIPFITPKAVFYLVHSSLSLLLLPGCAGTRASSPPLGNEKCHFSARTKWIVLINFQPFQQRMSGKFKNLGAGDRSSGGFETEWETECLINSIIFSLFSELMCGDTRWCGFSRRQFSALLAIFNCRGQHCSHSWWALNNKCAFRKINEKYYALPSIS